MKIKESDGIYSFDDEHVWNRHYYQLKCSECGRRNLSTGYCILMESLKDFLPKDYEYLCCFCRIIKIVESQYGDLVSLHNERCGGKFLRAYNDDERMVIFCSRCFENVINISLAEFRRLNKKYKEKLAG